MVTEPTFQDLSIWIIDVCSALCWQPLWKRYSPVLHLFLWGISFHRKEEKESVFYALPPGSQSMATCALHLMETISHLLPAEPLPVDVIPMGNAQLFLSLPLLTLPPGIWMWNVLLQALFILWYQLMQIDTWRNHQFIIYNQGLQPPSGSVGILSTNT